MKYLSVCSGIEAATQAWHPLGWTPVAFSEIEKFPSALLAHHYPDVPNWGDMTKFKEWPDAAIDVLVGGTPCQSFSVAGLRKGLDDPRGNLALTYLAIAERYRPQWLVWENVPGVLSAEGGRAFGAIVGGMVKLGYCPAWRVLDAQYVRTQRFLGAVPQRRRRVFVVAHLGDWRRAAAVLFDSESLRGNPPPSREAREEVAAPLVSGAPNGSPAHGFRSGTAKETNLVPEAHSIRSDAMREGVAKTPSADAEGRVRLRNPGMGVYREVAPTLDTGAAHGVAHTLRAEHDASEDGTGRGTPIVPEVANPLTHRMHKGINTTLDEGQTPLPVAFHNRQDPDISGDVTHPLGSMDNGMAVAFDLNQITSKTNRSQPDPSVHHTLPATTRPPHVASPMAVRRLTPVECERLQGFPDNFTQIPWRGKDAEQCPDGPRYKALGNSMAVNCMEWIGCRIQMVSELEVGE